MIYAGRKHDIHHIYHALTDRCPDVIIAPRMNKEGKGKEEGIGRLTIYLPISLKRKLEDRSYEERTSQNQLVVRALEEYLSRPSKKK